MGRIVSLRTLAKILPPHRAVLIGGVFDLIHVGHLDYLKKGAKLGHPLVVNVKSDAVTKLRKGSDRPFISAKNRAKLVAALGFVDYAFVCDENSCSPRILNAVRPKYVVVSGESKANRKYCAEVIRQHKAKLKFLGGSSLERTSSIVARVREGKKKGDFSNSLSRYLRKAGYALPAHSEKIVVALCSSTRVLVSGKKMHGEIPLIQSLEKKQGPLENVTLFCACLPCPACAAAIRGTALRKIRYLDSLGELCGLRLLQKAGVDVKQLKVN